MTDPRPFESAPQDEEILVWWPRRHAAAHDPMPDGAIVGGVWFVSEKDMSGNWYAPDRIYGHGLHLEDGWCWAIPLPPSPIEGRADD